MESQKKSGAARFARIVSYVFDGSVLALPIFIAASFYNQSNITEILPSFFTAIIFIAIIPYSFILFLYKSRRISDLQIPSRRERLFPLLIINSCVIIGFFVLIYMQPQRLLLSVYAIYLLGLPLVSLITLFWKISFHACYITLFSFVYLIVFGKWAVLTLALIPLVGWSRIKLGRHTLAQVLAGIAAMGTISLTVFYLTGFLTTDYWAVSEISYLFRSTSSYIALVLPGFGVCLLFIVSYIFLKLYLNAKKPDSGVFSLIHRLPD